LDQAVPQIVSQIVIGSNAGTVILQPLFLSSPQDSCSIVAPGGQGTTQLSPSNIAGLCNGAVGPLPSGRLLVDTAAAGNATSPHIAAANIIRKHSLTFFTSNPPYQLTFPILKAWLRNQAFQFCNNIKIFLELPFIFSIFPIHRLKKCLFKKVFIFTAQTLCTVSA
jgi:hypothetical protein